MTQTNFLTVIDYGSSEIRLGVFDEKKINYSVNLKVYLTLIMRTIKKLL